MYTFAKPVTLCIAAALLASPLAGCATTAAPAGVGSFDGSWQVKWCHPTRADLDCGGFSITLVEKQERICGTYDGARANLHQIDEGAPDSIKGARIGNTAILAVESARSGAIYLIRADLTPNGLAWKYVDEVREPDSDIDIIAMDEVLSRNTTDRTDVRAEVVKSCR